MAGFVVCVICYQSIEPQCLIAFPASQLQRLSLVGDYDVVSKSTPDFKHQLSTLTGLQALQVPAHGLLCCIELTLLSLHKARRVGESGFKLH